MKSNPSPGTFARKLNEQAPTSVTVINLERMLVKARDLANQLAVVTREIGSQIASAEAALRNFRQQTLPLPTTPPPARTKKRGKSRG